MTIQKASDSKLDLAMKARAQTWRELARAYCDIDTSREPDLSLDSSPSDLKEKEQ